MAKNMGFSVKMAFPGATPLTDRFHMVKLAMESLQHLRIKQRWIEFDNENKAIQRPKKEGKKYKPIRLSNGDTKKQLLARSKYVIAKKPNNCTEDQKQRASLLFKLYPYLETAYKRTLEFRGIYLMFAISGKNTALARVEQVRIFKGLNSFFNRIDDRCALL